MRSFDFILIGSLLVCLSTNARAGRSGRAPKKGKAVLRVTRTIANPKSKPVRSFQAVPLLRQRITAKGKFLSTQVNDSRSQTGSSYSSRRSGVSVAANLGTKTGSDLVVGNKGPKGTSGKATFLKVEGLRMNGGAEYSFEGEVSSDDAEIAKLAFEPKQVRSGIFQVEGLPGAGLLNATEVKELRDGINSSPDKGNWTTASGAEVVQEGEKVWLRIPLRRGQSRTVERGDHEITVDFRVEQ